MSTPLVSTMLDLTCRDPIVSRDGRPFGRGQGIRMRSAGWPLPSVVAGSLRTALGKAAVRDFSNETARELLAVEVAGVLPRAGGQLYLPAPRDCVVRPDGTPLGTPLRARPQSVEDGGFDWPNDGQGLRPVMLSRDDAPEEFKAQQAPAWWPADRYADWLTGGSVAFDGSYLSAPAEETRTHVGIDPATGAADEGQLFTTVGLPLAFLERFAPGARGAFADRLAEITLAVRVRASGWCAETARALDTLHALGGERRLVRWRAAEGGVWSAPERIAAALASARNVRLVLATPAIFRDGWKPGWLDERLVGSPPGTTVRLRLAGVSTERWKAVSGWSLADLPEQPRGPKPIRRMVPAGGVYFFELADGRAADLTGSWLESVSDGEQDRRDGFGLAVWGTW